MTRDQAIALMIQLEGGEANVKGDPGGHTKYGITQATLDRLRRNMGYNSGLPQNVADLTPEQAAAIYQSVQWPSIRGDDLPNTLAPLVLNAAVNMGEPRAVMLLQEAVGAPQTGNLGNITLTAVRNWRSPYGHGQTLPEEYAATVAFRYSSLDNKNPDLTQFELGWFRRLFRVYTLAVLSS